MRSEHCLSDANIKLIHVTAAFTCASVKRQERLIGGRGTGYGCAGLWRRRFICSLKMARGLWKGDEWYTYCCR